MPKPTMVIVLEGGLIQDIFTDGTHQIVVIDRDGNYDDETGRWCEDEECDVFDYGTAPLSSVGPHVMEAICKHLNLENPHATIGATPPPDSQ